jgi:hypothetical protein
VWLLRRTKTGETLGGATPLFPLGAPRSGTTLLARILNAHPGVLMTNETAVFLLLHENIKKSRQGVQAGILYGKEYHDLWSAHLAENAQRLIESYYEKICRAAGKRDLRYWGEKHPHHNRCLDFIGSLYPAARYVYIVRDPRDTACSIAAMRGTTFRAALETWRHFAGTYEQFARALPPERLHCMRYEDLAADYESESRRLFGFLRLDYHRRVARFLAQYRNVDMHTNLGPRAARADFGLTSVGRWRREVGEADQAYAQTLSADYLDRHGYDRAA